MQFERWGITGWLAIAMLAVSAGLFASMGISEETVRLWIRSTAWMSVTFFLLAFAARPLRQFWRAEATRALLKNRRYVGVSGAFAHLIHGIGIVWLLVAYPETSYEVDAVVVIFGGLGFVFYFAMGLTSSDAAVARLGPANWKRLHTFGGYYVWFIFAFTFLGSAAQGSVIGAVFLFDCLAVLGLRAAARIQKRSAAVPA